MARTNFHLKNSNSFCIDLVYPTHRLYQLLKLIVELFDFLEHPILPPPYIIFNLLYLYLGVKFLKYKTCHVRFTRVIYWVVFCTKKKQADVELRLTQDEAVNIMSDKQNSSH